MTTYPSHFSQSLGNAGSMAYLKASPTYHLNGLSALGMSHGLDSLQSQSIHYGGGKYLVWVFCNSIWDFDCDSIGYWTYFWNIELSILCKKSKLLYTYNFNTDVSFRSSGLLLKSIWISPDVLCFFTKQKWGQWNNT